MKLLYIIPTFLLPLVLSSCGSSADPAPTEKEKSSESTESKSISPDASTENETTVKIKMLKSPKTAKYLEGVALRLPDGVQVTDAQMIKYGKLGCEYTDGYVTGSAPNPSDRLMQIIMQDGVTQDEGKADDVADAARNAGMDTLCIHSIGK